MVVISDFLVSFSAQPVGGNKSENKTYPKNLTMNIKVSVTAER